MIDDKTLDKQLNKFDVPEFDPEKALGQALKDIEAMEVGDNVVSFQPARKPPNNYYRHFSLVGAALTACFVIALWFNVSVTNRPTDKELDVLMLELAEIEQRHEMHESELLGLFDVAQLEVQEENIDLFLEQLYIEELDEKSFWDSLTDG